MCEEKKSNKFTFTVNQALDRAEFYTNLSKSVLNKNKKEPTDPPRHLQKGRSIRESKI